MPALPRTVTVQNNVCTEAILQKCPTLRFPNTKEAALPKVVLDTLEYVTFLAMCIADNGYSFPEEALELLQNLFLRLSNFLEVVDTQSMFSAEDSQRLAKTHCNLGKAICSIALKNDKKLNALLAQHNDVHA